MGKYFDPETGKYNEIDNRKVDAFLKQRVPSIDVILSNSGIPNSLSEALGEVTSGMSYGSDSNDPINPNHYKFGDMESKPFINNVCKYGGFLPEETPNVKDIIKYLIRYPRKNGIEDLKKCQLYLEELIEIRKCIEHEPKINTYIPKETTVDNILKKGL